MITTIIRKEDLPYYLVKMLLRTNLAEKGISIYQFEIEDLEYALQLAKQDNRLLRSLLDGQSNFSNQEFQKYLPSNTKNL